MFRLDRNDAILGAVAVALGVATAAGYAAWRAVSRESVTASERWSSFAEAMLFPGALVIAAIAVIVWLGWKANID